MTQAVLKNQVTKLASMSGIDQDDRATIADKLGSVLADSYRLLINTQGVHWNVQGPLFYSIHQLTETQYEDLFPAIDDIAERIRSLGFPAPQTMADFTSRSSLDDVDPATELKVQIKSLIDMNERVASDMRRVVEVAEKASDVKTADLLTERIGIHEQNAWMLRATIASA
jgi:starvation-inducible DNA-binding protein